MLLLFEYKFGLTDEFILFLVEEDRTLDVFTNLFGIVSLRLITLGGNELHSANVKFEKMPLSYGFLFSVFSLRLLESESLILLKKYENILKFP